MRRRLAKHPWFEVAMLLIFGTNWFLSGFWTGLNGFICGLAVCMLFDWWYIDRPEEKRRERRKQIVQDSWEEL